MSEPTTPRDYARLLAGQASLAGRTAFVAGGYGGIGTAIAWGLALAGARVAVGGRHRADGATARRDERDEHNRGQCKGLQQVEATARHTTPTQMGA